MTAPLLLIPYPSSLHAYAFSNCNSNGWAYIGTHSSSYNDAYACSLVHSDDGTVTHAHSHSDDSPHHCSNNNTNLLSYN